MKTYRPFSLLLNTQRKSSSQEDEFQCEKKSEEILSKQKKQITNSVQLLTLGNLECEKEREREKEFTAVLEMGLLEIDKLRNVSTWYIDK